MSFLDVISCGFGAVILLLVLALGLEPSTVVRITADLRQAIEEREQERSRLVAAAGALRERLAERTAALSAAHGALEEVERQWQAARLKTAEAEARGIEQKRIERELEAVRQTLSDEMKRLLSQPSYVPPAADATIGGIPVDSEYVIFIIDTSGSMQRFAWSYVLRRVDEVFETYPNMKGIQVLNDMGTYMFSAYAGQWIPDSPSRRKEIIRRLRGWKSFSNSSPVEGIEHAIARYYKEDKRISLYVFGDDFSGGSINEVLHTVEQLNRRSEDGNRRVRIHAFGFPVLFQHPMGARNRARFAHLMRLLAEQNSGSFVGLATFK